jgi:hypothetical protein
LIHCVARRFCSDTRKWCVCLPICVDDDDVGPSIIECVERAGHNGQSCQGFLHFAV